MIFAVEGFDHFGFARQTWKTDYRFGSVQGYLTDGRYSDDGLVPADFATGYMNAGFSRFYSEYSFTATNEIFLGFHLRPYTNNVIWTGEFLQVGYGLTMDSSYLRKVVAYSDGTGKIQFFYSKANPSDTYWPQASVFLGETDATALVYGEWAFYEFHFRLSDGYIEARKNGTVICTVTGAAMGGGNVNRAGWAFTGFGYAGPEIDHAYYLTPGGASSDFLGVCRVATAVPRANYLVDMTPHNAASNWQCQVDRSVGTWNLDKPDDDYTYVDSSTAGERDLYYMERLYDMGTIFAVQLSAFLRCVTPGDTGSVSIIGQSPEGTLYDWGPYAVPYNWGYDGYQYRAARKVLETDPYTGLAWTDARLLDWKFGIRNETSKQIRLTQFALERLTSLGTGIFSIWRVH